MSDSVNRISGSSLMLEQKESNKFPKPGALVAEGKVFKVADNSCFRDVQVVPRMLVTASLYMCTTVQGCSNISMLIKIH